MKSLWKTPYDWIAGWASKGLGGIKLIAAILRTISVDYKYQIAALLLLAVISAALVILLHPPEWVPKIGKAGVLLGSLLGAQAAIAAFTLAVTLFVMQAISNRPDADDQTYHEYIRRSWVRGVLRFSLMAVGITGAVLLVDTFGGSAALVGSPPKGLPNLVFPAVFAFASNLLLAGVLFGRSIHLLHPEQWTNLRRDVNRLDAHRAIEAYVRRRRQDVDAIMADQPIIRSALPTAEEGSANRAISRLLDDARKSMRNGSRGGFTQSVDSIKELLGYALDEFEKAGFEWDPFSPNPDWPPLRELGRNLYPFRQEVIQDGSQDFVFDLLSMDYWLTSTGIRRGRREMLSVGLAGYLHNYQIAVQLGGTHLQEILRDRFNLNLMAFAVNLKAADARHFGYDIIDHIEAMLSQAMHSDRPEDFEKLHRDFGAFFRYVEFHWNLNRWPEPPEAELHRGLGQQFRIWGMGLAGRAVELQQAERINSATTYLEVTRRDYPSIAVLSRDISRVFNPRNPISSSLWENWEYEGGPPAVVRAIQPERYPLTFFAVRLLESSETVDDSLDLYGNAKRVLEWFLENGVHLEQQVRVNPPSASPEPTFEDRYKNATATLQLAVRRDELSEMRDIASRKLDSARVQDFIASVQVAAIRANPIEGVFQRAGAFSLVSSTADDNPGERGLSELVPKAYFAEDSQSGQMFYEPIRGDRRGHDIAYGVTQLLCEQVGQAKQLSASLDTVSGALEAIENIQAELGVEGGLLLVWCGDWFDIEVELDRQMPVGYQPRRQVADPGNFWVVGRYRGHLIVEGTRSGNQRMYVVDPRTWGIFVRGQFDDGRDLRVDIRPISAEYAQVVLEANPDYFSEEPDRESKLLRLQATVEVTYGIRQEFRVVDPTRARVVVSEIDGLA